MFTFKLPKKNSVYIYLSNKNNRKDIIYSFMSGVDFSFFYSARHKLILRPSLILYGIYSRFFSKYRSFNHGYLLALIKCINPKILITLIDNSIFFQYLDKKFHKKIKFITIQNATRGQLLERDLGKNFPVFHSNLFCWGESERDFYRDYGANVLNYHFIGSLRDSLYRQKFSNFATFEKIYDIYIPSNYRTNPHYFEKLKILMKFISKIANEKNLNVVVGLRLSKEDNRKSKYIDEVNFYKKYLNCNYQLKDNNQIEYSNYNLSDKSKISIGFNTAILKEAFGRQNKILTCNFTEYKYYDFPVEGFWSIKEENYEAFKKIFLYIFDMKKELYISKIKKYSNYVIGYDNNCPTHIYLNNYIKKNYEQ